MSSSTVRALVEGWLKDAAMVVPYYPTVNEEQNPTDTHWCTARFNASLRERLTFCDGNTNEEGDVEIVYYGRPGVGEDELLALVEADMITLMAQRDPTGDMVILNRSAPFEFSGGSVNRLYGLSIFLDYQFYE